MTIPKVQVGQSFSTALRAPTWNAFVDAANAYKQRGNPLLTFETPADELSTLTVLVQNNSGADLDYGAVVVPTGAIITNDENLAEFKARCGFVCDQPSAAYHGNFFVLAEPIPDGKIGLGIAQGIAAVQINVTDTTLKRADIDGTNTGWLVTKPNGTAQILWQESGTGTIWGYVKLGVLRDAMVVGKTNGTVTAGSTGEVTVYNNGTPTSTVLTGVKLDWMHGGQQISSGKEVAVAWFAEERVWRFVGAECE